MSDKLEDEARKLLKWKITGEGEKLNPFTQTKTQREETSKQIQFLVNQGYVVQKGGTPKSLRYEITPKGKKFALP